MNAILSFIFGVLLMAGGMGKADILRSLSSAGNRIFTGDNLLEWSYTNIKLRIGGETVPFTLDGHEPLRELYTLEDHPHETDRKGGQLGVSIKEVIKNYYRAIRWSMTIGYFLPTDEETEDFVDGKVRPIEEDSELISSLMAASRTDNKGLKRIGKSAIYFRGVVTKRKVKTISLDGLVRDEFDEANQENLKFSTDRLRHSKYGFITDLSQPSIDDFGIDLEFKKGDSRYWGVKCSGCGEWNFVDQTWPDCLMTRGSTVYYGCIHCNKKLNMSKGLWVPEHPDRSKDHRSYHLSHLIFPAVTPPAKLKKEYEGLITTVDKKNFSISVLGRPYASANSKPITDEVLNNAERSHGFVHEARFSHVGMDVGDKCHLVFLGPQKQVINVGSLVSDDEEGIIRFMKRMGIYSGVIDAMPYKTLAKNISRAFPGRCFINYYKGDTLKTGEEGEGQFAVPKVSVNRDESLDETVESLREGRITLPSRKRLTGQDLVAYEEFRAQVKMLIKDPEDKDGVIEYHYKKNVPNHYGMALNYARIAAELSTLNLVSGVDPIGVDL